MFELSPWIMGGPRYWPDCISAPLLEVEWMGYENLVKISIDFYLKLIYNTVNKSGNVTGNFTGMIIPL